MCCRHDDAGEVPSKLEVLTKMASELVTSAVENGRWHHAADPTLLLNSSLRTAAVAFSQEQHGLSTYAEVCIKRNFSSFFPAVSMAAEEVGKCDAAPAMTQSAASDRTRRMGGRGHCRREHVQHRIQGHPPSGHSKAEAKVAVYRFSR